MKIAGVPLGATPVGAAALKLKAPPLLELVLVQLPVTAPLVVQRPPAVVVQGVPGCLLGSGGFWPGTTTPGAQVSVRSTAAQAVMAAPLRSRCVKLQPRPS